ncbi:MAG: c-type cytochrome biogenesis protein CcmI [Methylovulum sp.]
MTTLFFILAAILVLVAFLIILPPLWRQKPMPTSDMDERNILIARHRLAELKEQRQSGGLSQSQYDEQVAELERALSDDLDIKSHVATSPSQGRWVVYVLMLAIPLLSGSLYWALGDYQAINRTEEIAAANASRPSMEQINKMVAGLAERMKNNPSDANGWVMLGQSYKVLRQYPKAIDAFEHAYKLLGDKAPIMLLYAETLAYANGEQLAGKPAELVFKALALEPDNISGLWLGGMAKAQQGDGPSAIKLWRKLEGLLPAGSKEQEETQGLIAELEAQLPAASTTPSPAASQQANVSGVSVDVQVSLASDLKNQTSPGDTVFVYAQALSGPKMPLAIVRKQVSDLPLTVNLSDAMAMTPTMKLSNFDTVKLLARISKSGNAMTQPGDLIGVIDQVTLADKKTHNITINGQVK